MIICKSNTQYPQKINRLIIEYKTECTEKNKNPKIKHMNYAPNNKPKAFPLVKSILLKVAIPPNNPNVKAVINPAWKIIPES